MNGMKEMEENPSCLLLGRKEAEGEWGEGKAGKDKRVLRFHSASMCIYFLILLVTVFITNKFSMVVFCTPCFLAYCLVFYMSYRVKTGTLLGTSCLVMTTFIAAFVLVFGWDCGVQYFIFVMVALLFATGRGSIRKKALQTVLLFLFYAVLYGITSFCAPAYEVTALMAHCIRLISAAEIFLALYSCYSLMRTEEQETEYRLKIAEERLSYYQHNDPLTGLPNRKSMMDYIQKLAADGTKGEQKRFCIAIGDVDCFERINDKYGHDCGDIVLKQLAYQFAVHMEELGRVGRWNGDSFLFVFDGVNGEDAYYYLIKLQQLVREAKLPWNDEIIKTTMTYGLMEYNYEKNVDHCIVEADKKMLMGKESGRNTIIF